MSVDPNPSPSPSRFRSRPRLIRAATTVSVAVVAVTIGVALYVYALATGSLPRLEGSVIVPRLQASVTIDRDDLGVPTLSGKTRPDVALALGFLHAQERFFQMDLLRRRSAGELSELFGSVAVEVDGEARLHGFRAVAKRALANLEASERAILDAYVGGVNHGLVALSRPPFEYLLLRQEPAPWRAEDSLLVGYSMFMTLHDETGRKESTFGTMLDTLPPPLFEFLAPIGTRWDAPLRGGLLPEPAMPGPEIVDLRGSVPAETASSRLALPQTSASEVGSNNWAVAGSLTPHGGALVANDMHLGISVPAIWYRAALSWREGEAEHHATGVTLPGAPNLIVGSNGHVAWGFTNSQGDWVDLVELEDDPADPADPDGYLTPNGTQRPQKRTEVVRIAGGGEQRFEFEDTIWGPVVDRDHAGRRRVVRWTAHSPDAVDFGLLSMETARNLDEALDIANRTGLPPQNFMCGDRSGRIGWTIIGRIPNRIGHDGRVPTSWANGERGWDGWLDPSDYPRVVDPPSGRLWTANARAVDGDGLRKVGDGNYALGARARQIRDGLAELGNGPVAPADLLSIQLDDRAIFLEPWRALLVDLLDDAAVAGKPERAELRRQLGDWSGHASVGSVAYRAVRAFRLTAASEVLKPLVAPANAVDPELAYVELARQIEGPLWRLVSERPVHLLDPRYSDWSSKLLAVVDLSLDAFRVHESDLSQRTWGERNTTRIRHPLSQAVPQLSGWLDMPAQQLPGDSHMPRVQHPANGASQRMVAAPGRDEIGLFHMPGGQSGHPLSPHYADSHAAWAEGQATPFLPGETTHRLILEPGRR